MKKIALIIFVALLAVVGAFIMDYQRALDDKKPIFVIRTALYKDGGTSIYHGLGYKVIDYNQIEGRKDVVFKSFIVSKGD